MYKNYLQQSSKETITNIKQLINITVKSKRAIKAVILPVCYTLRQLNSQSVNPSIMLTFLISNMLQTERQTVFTTFSVRFLRS